MIAHQLLQPAAPFAHTVTVTKASHASDASSGGDRVDAFEGPDGRLHLTVLDACGRGARANAFASFLLREVRELLFRGMPPGAVFRSLDATLVAQRAHGEGEYRFGTGAIVSLDPERSAMAFASAGHVEVLRFSRSGDAHFHHGATGPLFGVLDDARFSEASSPYASGDTFVLLTDGLVDARPADSSTEFLGSGGVCRIVRLLLASRGGLSASRLISRVRQVAGGAFEDDVAALVAVT
jgi:serine phosphatase RsbU (regulator of sigma subunit)